MADGQSSGGPGSRSSGSLSQGPRHLLYHRATKEDGAILVFWVLCLPVLAALLVGVLFLGDLLQSADNAQNAADAAALAAVDGLAATRPRHLVLRALPIYWRDRCGTDLSATNPCKHYGWLDGRYIYVDGQWELIGGPDGQISARAALAYGTAQGTWLCATPLVNRQGSASPYCGFLAVTAPGTPGDGPGADGALSDSKAVDAAAAAARNAESVLQHYGFTNDSGCTAPHGFLLAEGSTGVTCIGYDAAGTAWVEVPTSTSFGPSGLAAIRKSSWATMSDGTAVLCPGRPPAGNCD